MRFPVFNHFQNFTATGESLSAEQFFNPTINGFFDVDRTNQDAVNGLITFGTVTKILHELCTVNTDIGPLAKGIANRLGANYSEGLYKVLYQELFAALPEDKKWLAFYATFAGTNDVAGCTTPGSRYYRFKLSILHPTSVSYHESYRSKIETTFDCTLTGAHNDASFTDDQRTHLKAVLTDTFLAVAVDAFNTLAGRKIVRDDRMVPLIVALIYNYTTNMYCYSPQGEPESFDFPYDNYTPNSLLYYMTRGHNVNFVFRWDTRDIRFFQPFDPSSRRSFEKIFAYSTNVLQHLPYTIKGPKETSATLYGVELEASSNYPPKKIIEAQKELFFLLKQDSSIHGTGQHAYEMVTVPCSLRAHKRLWAEFFDKIDYAEFDTSKSTGNGMHIHIDKKAFTPTGQYKGKGHLDRFTWFFINPGHYDFVFAMSERPSKMDLDRWAAVTKVAENQPYYSQAKQAANLNRGRGAIHFKGPTVEVRIFKGLVSYATIVKNLEFVDSVVEYTRNISFAKLSLTDYFAWLNNTPKNKYEMLKAFLKEIKTAPLETAAKLDRYLWGTNSDTKIVEKLNKAPFKVTNEHLTILNKRKRKRTFVLKNGKVDCIFRNGATLSKLDQIAQKRQVRGSATFVSSTFNS